VLYATDFSRASGAAFRTAVAWARRHRAALDIVHVLVPPSPFVVPEGIAVPTWKDLEARARQAARTHLFGLKAAAARSGLRARTHLPTGLPEEEVGRVARRRRAGLVVIGTHGRTGLARALLGSVAERIVRTSGCPVLAVRGRR
jgi:nucleotide-binding universal stress UspA family protein